MPRWVVLAALLVLLGVQPSLAQTATPTPQDTFVYTVHSGDTLGSIAARYHSSVSALMQLNNLTNAELVVIGQRLLIPSAGLTPTPAPSEAQPPVPEATVNPPATEATSPSFDYGIEAFFSDTDVSDVIGRITTLGMHWTKLRVSWRDLETTRGEIDYTKLDAVVDGLGSVGLKILFTVTAAPDWARSSQIENGPPDNFDDYAAFIGALAARYAGRVQAYEVWNEPNLRREWNSSTHPLSAQGYADLLRRAYSAVKTADPSALVVSAGLAPTGFNDGVNALDSRQFLQALYQNGLAQISDAIGAHPFGFANPPDLTCCAAPPGVMTHYGHPSFYFLDTLNDYRAIMVTNGDAGKLIWVTQFGWGTSADSSAPPRNSAYVADNSLAQQAQYLQRGFELGARLGYVGVMIDYNLNSCTERPDNAEACYYSLIAPSGVPRPAYNTLSTMFATALAP